jgi:esterase/lipase
MEKNYDSIIDQIKKVKLLSEKGIDNEKENAKLLLEKLLKKYNVSLEELLIEDRKEYKFKYKTEFDKKILFQCLAKFAPNVKEYRKYIKINNKVKKVAKNIIVVNLTKMEFLDVEASAKFYNKLFNKELELFLYAFLSKHNIFRENNEKEDIDTKNESKFSKEEISSIISMMSGMRDDEFIATNKQIESPKSK